MSPQVVRHGHLRFERLRTDAASTLPRHCLTGARATPRVIAATVSTPAVPRAARHGFAVDLRERNPRRPSVQEILHIRFDYSWMHLKRLAEWSGADLPDIEAARDRHLYALRAETGRTDFGEVGG